MHKLEIDILCPSCKRKLKQRVEDMRPGKSKRCICGTMIEFTGDDGREAQRALDSLERTIKILRF